MNKQTKHTNKHKKSGKGAKPKSEDNKLSTSKINSSNKKKPQSKTKPKIEVDDMISKFEGKFF
jgi:hypothetical protein